MGLGKPDPDALVFGDPDGAPMLPNNLTRRWQDVCIARGLPQVMFHALRHSHASALIATGVDVVKISRRLGHADPTVTLRSCAHLFDKVDTATADAIKIALTPGARGRRW
jgi:integrase